MITKNLDSVKEVFIKELVEMGKDVSNMDVKYSFAKKEYSGICGDVRLITKKECLRLFSDTLIEEFKNIDYSSITDDEYESHFKVTILTKFDILSKEVELLNIENVNGVDKKYYVVDLSKDEFDFTLGDLLK